jgi:predicted amidohydrolase
MSRMARIATVALYIDRQSLSMQTRIQSALALVEEASQWKPDLIVLPEEFELYGLINKA